MTSVLSPDCNSGGNSDCCISLSSTMSFQEKCSRNKRKFRADPPLIYENRVPSTLSNDQSDYDLSSVQFDISSSSNGHPGGCDTCRDISNTVKLDIGLSHVCAPSEIHSRDEDEVDQYCDVYWSHDTEGELENLIVCTLDVIFRTAVQKIVACGYTEEAAMEAVMCPGICYGSKDTVSNVLENAFSNLTKGRGIDTSRDHYFKSLLELEKYVLAELVCVLRELRPFFSTGDAMWHLLMCDMNISQACEVMEASDAPDSVSFNGLYNGSSPVSQIPQQKHEQTSNLTPPQNPDSSFQKPNNCLNPCGFTPQSEATFQSVAKFSNSNGRLFTVKTSEKACLIPSPTNRGKLFGTSVAPNRPECERAGNGRRTNPNISKRESLSRHKSLHSERSHRTYGAKGGSRSVKFGGLGGMNLEKKLKRVADFPTVNFKDLAIKATGNKHRNRSFKTTSTREGSSSSFGLNNESVDSDSLLPTSPCATSELHIHGFPCADTELSLSLHNEEFSPMDVACTLGNSKHTSTSFPCETLMGRCKDDMILRLFANVHELQNQLEEWTEWVNEKVMQAARRLGKDKSELKALRQEKEEVERLKREKHSLEESTMKKLSEMDSALCKASEQVDNANSSVLRLEVENETLRQEMELMKLRAVEAAASCQAASAREKKTMMKSQSWEKQKSLLQEELLVERKKLALLNQELQQARDLHNQLEERRKQERKGKEDILAERVSARREREKAEALWKSKEEMVKKKAENRAVKVKADVVKLEKEISQLRLKTETCKIAALRSGGGYPAIADLDGRGKSGGEVRRERECVMCLSEEMSVVFLPCAHQVLCSTCNNLHQKKGMKDCPSCRTPILRRIPVLYAPRH